MTEYLVLRTIFNVGTVTEIHIYIHIQNVLSIQGPGGLESWASSLALPQSVMGHNLAFILLSQGLAMSKSVFFLQRLIQIVRETDRGHKVTC